MAPNTTTIDIRAATSADAPAIADIHVASWQATYTDIMPAPFLAGLSVEKRTAAWRYALGAGRPRVALAITNDAPAGWIAYGPTRDT
ncbi:GNAT family N-acetyltransferase, partial [Escherichia coli]|uniref:GNAT family N-acetyltransferase n=2 Tax=Pseudomonadota TaxID=1224 RepID=UPI0017EFEFB9|nr:GNAT family N-acetyltransferase [Escherichia coli]